MEDIKATIEKYSKLSNDELMLAFAQQIAAQKAKDGGASMRKTLERIMPLLNPAQRKRVEEILKSVDAR